MMVMHRLSVPICLCDLCASVVKSIAFAFLAAFSLTSAVQLHNLHCGGYTGASRRFVSFQRRAPSLPPT